MIKRKNNYKIYFDKNISFECYDIQSEWKVGSILTESDIQKIKYEDEEIKIKRKSLYYISNRDYSEFELKMKLKRKGFSDKPIDKILNLFKTENLINENQVAENILKAKTDKNPEGSYLIKMRLEYKKIPPTIINKIIKKAQERDEFSLAYSIAEKKFNLLQKRKKSLKNKEKIYYFLQRKGFSTSIILKIIEKLKNHHDME